MTFEVEEPTIRHYQSDRLDELAKALIGAQSTFPVIPKTKTGKIKGEGSRGSYEYSYHYADFPNVKAAIDPVLHRCGLVVIQSPAGDGLMTMLLHVSGQWLREVMSLHLAKLDPQGQGSAITYGKRYAYSAITGCVTDEDDDGASASGQPPVQQTQTAAARVEAGFPGAAPEPAPQPAYVPPGESATDKQTKAIYAILMSRYIEDKQVQLDVVSGIIGADCTDTRQLTKAQAGKVIDQLNKPASGPVVYAPGEEQF